MTSAVEANLPDPEILQQVGLGLVAAAPAGWVTIELAMLYHADDVYGHRFWVTVDGGRERLRPPDAHLLLDDLRDDLKRRGQEPFNRVDVMVSRANPAHDEPDFKVEFGYEMGEFDD